MTFILNKSTEIVLKGTLHSGVLYAANILKRDLEKVLLTETNPRNQIIVSMQNIDLENDQFQMICDSNKVEIIAKNDLGLIYGLLYISKQYLQVDPFWFWNDLNPHTKDEVLIEEKNFISPKYKVRFRGWFINDEVLISKWKMNGSNEVVWRMAFEALLRCGGNMVIPGTDIEDSTYKRIASEMGLWLTHHHAEPLGAQMFSRIHPDKQASYTKHKELFEELWTKAIEMQYKEKTIWNVGFRGQGDCPFWESDPSYDTDEKRGALISEIIQNQIALISEYQKNPVCCVNLYGEVAELYKGGDLKLPNNVIKIWADSGYGKMVSRRQNNHNPRISAIASSSDSGPHGIYYHATFYDLQASNHLTMLPNTVAFVKDELENAFSHEMDEFLIVNCGNIRPHLLYLDLVSKIWQENTDIEAFKESYFSRYYPTKSQVIKDIYEDFQKAIIQYGTHLDERAGEQLYFYTIRYLAFAWSKKLTYSKDLIWLSKEQDFYSQINDISQLIENSLENWILLEEDIENVLSQTINEQEKSRIENQIAIQIKIHSKGIQALKKTIDALLLDREGDHFDAFIILSEAENFVRKIVEKLNEEGKWKGFYDNDCLTNIHLTLEILNTIKKQLRLMNDGPNFYRWEKEYLTPASESSVMLLTNKTKQLSDEELFQRYKYKDN